MVKVLLVDDDGLLRNLFSKRLEHVGYEVELAGDGEAGLVMAEQFQPDIILTDYQMPKLNGDGMMIQLRATEWGKSIPAIMMSAVSSLEEIAEMGIVDALMYKPITNRELLTVIEEVLNHGVVKHEHLS